MSPRRERHKDENAEQSPEAPRTNTATAPVDKRLHGLPDEVVELVEELRAERDEAQAARMRALADFKNYQRRSVENEARALESGKSRVVRELLPVLDQFELALRHDAGQMSVEQLAAGVNIVRQEMFKALQSCGLETIDPMPGDEFDPQRHDAVMHQPSQDYPPGSVVQVYQTGYVLDNMVLRPAKVVIASAEDIGGEGEQR